MREHQQVSFLKYWLVDRIEHEQYEAIDLMFDYFLRTSQNKKYAKALYYGTRKIADKLTNRDKLLQVMEQL